MVTRKCFYCILKIIFLIIVILCNTTLAKEPRSNGIKLIVKQHPESSDSIKDIMIKLNEFAKDMEKRAKSYSTINKKDYWESEAKKLFLKYLQAEGYYHPIIDTESPEEKNLIIFYINPLVRYRIKEILFKYADNSNRNINIPALEKLKIKEGDFAVANLIIDTQKLIAKDIEKSNCILSLEVSHEAVIDHAEDAVSVSFIINAGSYAKVKSIDFRGLVSVNPEYARKLIPFKPGQCFQPSLITETQNSLQKTGLFSIINPKIPEHPDSNNEAPIIFELKERKHRSVKAGLNYGTDLGFGGTVGWDHRNLLGNGETVKTEIFTNQKEQSIDLTFTKPFYKRDDQKLKIGLSAENAVSKAFVSKEGAIFAGIERKLTDIWTASVSGKYSYSTIKDSKGKQNFSFLSAPLYIKRDTRDNILNPRKGNDLQFKAEPFYPIKKQNKAFVKSEVIASEYFPLKSKFDPVVAVSASIGSISGTNLTRIPANERFYIGGIGSVRGYAYQLAGKLDEKNRPIGGRSMLEASIELRTRMKSDIGVVFFLDSGNVFTSAIPGFKQKMFNGFGLGGRYFTDFGPLRLDIGFPLEKRKGVDKAFQVYFGIGQNF